MPHEFSHQALLYDDAEHYRDGVPAFLDPGFDRGDPIILAVPPQHELICEIHDTPVCELVEIRSSTAGTTVRLHAHLH
jgi:hypothetical protein